MRFDCTYMPTYKVVELAHRFNARGDATKLERFWCHAEQRYKNIMHVQQAQIFG